MANDQRDSVQQPARRSAFILTIFAQGNDGAWRGVLETSTGGRRYFASLDALNALLLEYGWTDCGPTNSTDSQESAESPSI